MRSRIPSKGGTLGYGNLFTRALRVVEAEVGLLSNNRGLLFEPEYFEGKPHPCVVKGNGWLIQSQTANFSLLPAEFRPPPELDGYLYILDYPGIEASISVSDRRVVAFGDWTRLERETSDRRYTLLGNQGLLFRFILTLLERRGIYNFHACALYDEREHEVILALGERGSGKSAFMLSALEKGGFKLLGTEIVHVAFRGGKVAFYKGTLRNNVRVGHLLYDFPGVMKTIGVRFSGIEDPWGTKVEVSLEPYGFEGDAVLDPSVTLVIPRIEEDARVCRFSYVENKRKLRRNLMENLCDKISSLAVIYESIPIGSLDNADLMRRRLEFVKAFLGRAVRRTVSLFANPRNCLEGWL